VEEQKPTVPPLVQSGGPVVNAPPPEILTTVPPSEDIPETEDYDCVIGYCIHPGYSLGTVVVQGGGDTTEEICRQACLSKTDCTYSAYCGHDDPLCDHVHSARCVLYAGCEKENLRKCDDHSTECVPYHTCPKVSWMKMAAAGYFG
jgi:hypothetical protein